MDELELIKEVESTVNEIKYAVKKAAVQSNDRSSFTVVTQEDHTYLLTLSNKGFFVQSEIGSSSSFLGCYFETIYSFLDKASPGYRRSFCKSLADKLNKIQ